MIMLSYVVYSADGPGQLQIQSPADESNGLEWAETRNPVRVFMFVFVMAVKGMNEEPSLQGITTQREAVAAREAPAREESSSKEINSQRKPEYKGINHRG